jgi:hypothetical protein
VEFDDDRGTPREVDTVRKNNKASPNTPIIDKFRNPDWANRIVLMLLEIERDPILSMTVENLIATIAEQARIRKENSKPPFRILK